jgi:hypothetical protein
MTNSPAYHITTEGFAELFFSLPDITAWLADLKAAHPWIIGKEAIITQGVRVGPHIAEFTGGNRRVVRTVSP